MRFEFGKNWLDFIEKNYDPKQVEIAKACILNFMKRDDLNGLSFLDIGCGSGLHSSAALSAGVKEVFAFDYDPSSVEATKYIQKQVGSPENWKVEQGSVLDSDFMDKLPQYDMVYSWGVLHHTGDVWTAIKNAAEKVKPGGVFFIALYSADVQINPTPEFWLEVKMKYVNSGWLKRRYLDWWYVWRFILGKKVANLPAFVKRISDHKKGRGMNIFTDIRDWLGGWPMEFVYDDEAVKFCEKLGFKLEQIKTGEACTEFLFTRNA